MSGSLEPFRERLNVLDSEIAKLFGERFDICRELAHYKSEHDIPMMQPERVAEVRERYLVRGAEVNLPPEFTAALFELLIGATCKLERPAGTYTWIPSGGGIRRCLAASYAQLLMKQVISTVINEVSLRPADPRSEHARKSAIAFVPHRHARVIARRRHIRRQTNRR